MTRKILGFFLFCLLFCNPAAAAFYTEAGDAGSLPGDAQITFGGGPLTSIFGDLMDLNDVDLFRIRIYDPLGFSASTVGLLGDVPDPRLFLFTNDGMGVYMNDDSGGTQALLPAGHPLGPLGVGLYLLGITRFDMDARSASGLIFNQDLQAVNGPFGPGGGDPLNGWDGEGVGPIDFDTFYEISMTGAAFAIPEPSTMSLCLLGFAAALAAARRGSTSR